MYSKSEFHGTPLPAEAVDDLITALAGHRLTGEARELDFSPWAGAYNAVAADATAFPHRSARFLLKHAATLTAGERATGTSGAGPLAVEVVADCSPIRDWRSVSELSRRRTR
jgi:hypothetical protein